MKIKNVENVWFQVNYNCKVNSKYKCQKIWEQFLIPKNKKNWQRK